MSWNRFLFVFLSASISLTPLTMLAKEEGNVSNNTLEVARASLKENFKSIVQKINPVQWISYLMSQHEKNSAGSSRIILVKNDMKDFIADDPESLGCIDPRIIVEYQTTTPNNQFQAVLVPNNNNCLIRFRQTARPWAVSGEWNINPSRKVADISGIVGEALEQVVTNEMHFSGFCFAHSIPCLNYGLNKPIIDTGVQG